MSIFLAKMEEGDDEFRGGDDYDSEDSELDEPNEKDVMDDDDQWEDAVEAHPIFSPHVVCATIEEAIEHDKKSCGFDLNVLGSLADSYDRIRVVNYLRHCVGDLIDPWTLNKCDSLDLLREDCKQYVGRIPEKSSWAPDGDDTKFLKPVLENDALLTWDDIITIPSTSNDGDGVVENPADVEEREEIVNRMTKLREKLEQEEGINLEELK